MAEIKKIYRQTLPAMKFVGKCYHDEDKVDGVFASKWGEWFEKGLFGPLEIPGSAEPFEDCNAYYGLCRCSKNEPFEYWIGVFEPLDFVVPEGYDSITLDTGDIAVAWVYGKEPDIYIYNSYDDIVRAGYEWAADKDGIMWCFERYVCPRFTTPDETGNVILDMCFYVK